MATLHPPPINSSPYSIDISWGEPLSKSLRGRRFESLLNVLTDIESWNLSMPDSKSNSFHARFETTSASSFDANMIVVRQFERDHILAFSTATTTSPTENHGLPTSIGTYQLLPSDIEKSVEITFDSSLTYSYCIGMHDLKFDDTIIELKDKAHIVHKVHLEWLKELKSISWELFQTLSKYYSSDRTIAKCVKTKLRSTLNKLIISLGCDSYHIGTTRIQSCSPLDLEYVFNIIHSDHLRWLNETTTLSYDSYLHLKTTYNSDCFLSESKYQVFAAILSRKYNLYMEQLRVDFENDYYTSFRH